MIFGTFGYYDISFKVTNGNGQSNTKNVQDMVFVDSDCACAPCVGFSNKYISFGDGVSDNSTCCIDLSKKSTWSAGGIWSFQ